VSNSVVRQGVILAAGRGSRLHPLSAACPKPLQPVCNKPIMQYQIEAMRDAGIREICLVVGPHGAPIHERFANGQQLGVQLSYIEDPAPAGIASSLARTARWVRGPFIVFLGDIFLALGDLSPALAPIGAGAGGTIVARQDTPDAVRRNFAVLVEADNRVTRVIEKPAEPPTGLKGCGVYVFDQMIFEAIARTPRSALRNEYEITDAVQALIDMGRPVYTADVVRWDVNITYPQDLLACNLRMLREQRLESLVGSEARVSEQVRLSSSIVGDRAIVDAPVVLEECLVMPETLIDCQDGVLRRRIFSAGLPAAGLALNW
jgi:dTDP-glucose pyrophosphorylase